MSKKNISRFYLVAMLSLGAVSVASCQSHSAAHTENLTAAPFRFPKGLTTGPNNAGIFRRVNIDQIDRVLAPVPKLPGNLANFNGMFYCRHCILQPGEKAVGLSSGAVLVSPSAYYMPDPNSFRFDVSTQGNYAFREGEDFANAGGGMYQLNFTSPTHAELLPYEQSHMISDDSIAYAEPAPTHGFWANMDLINHPDFGEVWVRHSGTYGNPLPDYYLIKVSDANGNRTPNFERVLLQDLRDANILQVSTAVSVDSDLAAPGSMIPDKPRVPAASKSQDPAASPAADTADQSGNAADVTKQGDAGDPSHPSDAHGR